MATQQPSSSSRRDFLKTSTALAAAGALTTQLVVPQGVYAAASDQIKVGLIGCGGRGTGAAGQALGADKNVVLHAMGDMFRDRLDQSLEQLKKSEKFADKIKVNPDTCFTGFDAYQKVLDSGVDLVILTTPPAFRPIHLKAAVAAGKHIFCEKPIATDAPGVRSVLQTVEEAKKKKLAVVSGFCWRYSLPERAIFHEIHSGRIGDVAAHYGVYNTGALWNRPRKPEWSDLEWQLRNWLYFTWLSGDHLVEQAVHTVDKMAWLFKDASPLKCVATGGRQTRTEPAYGHIFDHFSCMYEWQNGARGFIYCRQQEGCATDTSDHTMGTKGNADINSNKRVITGSNPWKYDGENPNMYQVEHDEMFASIRKGEPINNGVRMANSTMIAIMGRMAAYTGQAVTWDQAFNSKESLVPERLEFGPMPLPPVAMPGKTRLI